MKIWTLYLAIVYYVTSTLCGKAMESVRFEIAHYNEDVSEYKKFFVENSAEKADEGYYDHIRGSAQENWMLIEKLLQDSYLLNCFYFVKIIHSDNPIGFFFVQVLDEKSLFAGASFLSSEYEAVYFQNIEWMREKFPLYKSVFVMTCRHSLFAKNVLENLGFALSEPHALLSSGACSLFYKKSLSGHIV